MKPISTRPIFTLSFFATIRHRTFQKSHYFSFYTQGHSPGGGGGGGGHHSPRRPEDDRRSSVPVSVWWDFENCNLPFNTNVFRVGQCISNALMANRIHGPVQITAFGDVMQISRTNQEALSATGITLIHVPSGGKNSADRSLLVDLMYWVSQNPPPAHLFLISGDRDFACILHRLRMNKYNILLASPDSAPSVLCSAATLMWQWSSLLKGENLNGKLFNYPPDGPFNSWYGHFKAPLEDPFAISEQSSCINTDESVELISEPKIRPIPKAVQKLICQILDLYPEGVSITQLRLELYKSNLTIDKDLYGYKKFSRFLLAMPNVLKLRSGSDGQFLVQRVSNNKFLDESVTRNGESEVGAGFKKGGESSSSEDVNEKLKPPSALEPKAKPQSTNLLESQKEEKQNEVSSSTMTMQGMKAKAHATNLQDAKKEEKRKEITAKKKISEIRAQDKKMKSQEQLEKAVIGEIKDFSEKNDVVDTHDSDSEFGIMRKIWMKLTGDGDTKVSHKDFQKKNGKDITGEKTQIAEFVRPALFSPSSHEALISGKNAQTDDAAVDISSQDTSFLSQIMSWFNFSSSQEIDDKVETNGETADIVKVNNPNQLEMFSRESFWKELESFLDTPQGSTIFSQSRTRDQLVQNLQKQGSPSLKSLSKTELLHLIDFLISDKKRVEECNSRAFPFRLARPPPINQPSPNSYLNSNSNGLSQIFSGKNSPELGERKHQNPPHTGVPQPVLHKSSSSKTRNELLADCQKLTDYIVKEYPEGFNLGSFRKLFLEKNGYPLDLQKLGYEKLVSLFHIMPGVRIESNLIFPAGPFKVLDQVDSKSKSSIPSAKDDDSDSSWDELGPVDDSGHKEEKIGPILTRHNKKGKLADYEPVQDDDFSDSEDETSQSEVSKSKMEQESALLQILDSWYGNKVCDVKKDGSAEGVVPQPSAQTTSSGPKNESPVVGPTRKHSSKPGKSYTFVSEEDDRQDKLVNGILGSLKKSGEMSVDSRVLG